MYVIYVLYLYRLSQACFMGLFLESIQTYKRRYNMNLGLKLVFWTSIFNITIHISKIIYATETKCRAFINYKADLGKNFKTYPRIFQNSI